MTEIDIDPRRHNEHFSMDSIEAHVCGYADTLSAALRSVNWDNLAEAIRLIRVARGTIWVCGNGGSAAISDHLLCDMVKGTHSPNRPVLRVHSLVANTALLTACANDFSYEDCFARQLEMQSRSGDILIVISSSGNSPNILAVMHKAKMRSIVTIAFTGFSGGEAAKLADISIHVNAKNYGVVEDAHQVLMHNMAQYIFGMADTWPVERELASVVMPKGLPKPMVEIGGIPNLEHQLLVAKKHGCTKALLLVSYVFNVIWNHFRDGKQLDCGDQSYWCPNRAQVP